VRKRTETKTIEIVSVETKAGTAICSAPSRIAAERLPGPGSVDILDLDGASSTRSRRRAPAAERHDVDSLPSAERMMIELRIESGIETSR